MRMIADQNLNHTASHVLAAAVLRLYPNTKLGFGPAIEEGFYYDFEFEEEITDADLKKIEKEMKKIISGGWKVEQVSAITFENQPYKQELIDEFTKDGKELTYYGFINPSNGDQGFTDLCKGGHSGATSEIKNFKLLSLAGAYWRGNSDNKRLTRIYGTAWATKELLDQYLALIEERKERDHRRVGKDMNIFTMDPLMGRGFPAWLEDGMAIKNEIQKYIRETEYRYGFREVATPAFGAKELYEISGHWAHYQDTMFQPLKVENEELVMRPMTCPHHLVLYKMKRRSYRDLPMRISEQSRLYRYEKSGALSGLERVRSMELTEGHIIARQDQIEQEFENAYKLIQEALTKFGIQIDYVSLSLRDKDDKEKFYDDDKMWNEAENKLRNVLKHMGVEYKEQVGEAAFYGPKIDIQVRTILGREITMSTLQLDFLLPKKFEATFINDHEENETPVMIHRGLIGTYERFMAILLEQTKGVLPFWLAPRQFTVIPVNLDIHREYADEVYKKLSDLGFRVHFDGRNERVGKKIREAQVSKTKFQIVVGDDEVANKTVNVRAYGEQEQKVMTLDELVKMVKENN